jgi:hypothetical protein
MGRPAAHPVIPSRWGGGGGHLYLEKFVDLHFVRRVVSQARECYNSTKQYKKQSFQDKKQIFSDNCWSCEHDFYSKHTTCTCSYTWLVTQLETACCKNARQDKKQSFQDKKQTFLETSWKQRPAAEPCFRFSGNSDLQLDPCFNSSPNSVPQKTLSTFRLGGDVGCVTAKSLATPYTYPSNYCWNPCSCRPPQGTPIPPPPPPSPPTHS